MLKKRSAGSRTFDVFNYFILGLYAFITIIPLVYVISASFASGAEIAAKGFVIIPSEPTLHAYQYIFSTPTITRGLLVSFYITVVGTLINIVVTCMLAFPLADKTLPGRKFFMAMVTFTLLFGAGMIPNFLLVQELHLYNSLWALMLPSAISTWNLIVLKNFFQQIPSELIEAATIDGCNDVGILFRVVMPLSAPAIATFTLFYAVTNWNTFTNAIIYLNDADKMPIQVVLRNIIMMAQMVGSNEVSGGIAPPSESVKMGAIVVATVPILIVYPFLQKHFAKGVMVGSVKG